MKTRFIRIQNRFKNGSIKFNTSAKQFKYDSNTCSKHDPNIKNNSKIFKQIPQRFTKGSKTNQTRFKKIQKRFTDGPKNHTISKQSPTNSENMQTPFTKDSKLIEQDSNYNQRRFLFGGAVGRQMLSNGAALPSPNLLDTRCPHPNRPKRF